MINNLPGDGNKRDPERENWPCRVMLPILPIQSISGSRLLPSPGRPQFVESSSIMRGHRKEYCTLSIRIASQVVRRTRERQGSSSSEGGRSLSSVLEFFIVVVRGRAHRRLLRRRKEQPQLRDRLVVHQVSCVTGMGHAQGNQNLQFEQG